MSSCRRCDDVALGARHSSGAVFLPTQSVGRCRRLSATEGSCPSSTKTHDPSVRCADTSPTSLGRNSRHWSGAPPAMNDFGAFVPGPRARLEPTASGPLDGLTFVVKDLIDVAGHVTGAGNPDWAARQVPAARSAPVVERLLRAGATLVGKTITDELAFSLEGENHHYGTPLNPRAPDRLPGGSSSGSAVAVAAGLADLALGTDTGGSVRVPASFCGVYGYRPSHGRLSLDGVVPLAPSYDTVGLFARTAEYLHAAAHCLIGAPAVQSKPPRLLLATDALALAEPDAAAALRSAALRLGIDEE